MPQERREALFRGRVQGVGFRMTAERIARGFQVAGSVRNLDDGRVEVIAEGEPAEIDAFLDAIRRELGDKIRGVESTPLVSGASEPLFGFIIRY